jgi:adenine-specific DNA-methyltransferase
VIEISKNQLSSNKRIPSQKVFTTFRDDRSYVVATADCLDFVKSIPNDYVDLVITSPPYFMGKDYDRSTKIEDFTRFHQNLLPEIHRITKNGGSICWQVGNHVVSGSLVPLDIIIFGLFREWKDLTLRNRIIWTFGHGLHSLRRFSGRYETILWYTKGKEYIFDLDSVRIPQKYPGKKYYKGTKRGQYSGNPLGKNPGDVWEIPNVKANHIEKTIHPCQFPVALAQRLIKALCPASGIVFDPFLGSGSTGVAAVLESRKAIGCEINEEYSRLAAARIGDALANQARVRPEAKPIFVPDPCSSVAMRPQHFRQDFDPNAEIIIGDASVLGIRQCTNDHKDEELLGG